MDYDGNGLTDYLVITPAGGIALANRGLGTFLINDVIHPRFHATAERAFPFKLLPGLCVAPVAPQGGKSRRQNLLVLTSTGRLFELDNAPRP
jgi:hypothetical protein